jgi:hypothetical protein
MGMDPSNGDWPLEWRKCSTKYQHEKKVQIHGRYLVQWKNVHYKISDKSSIRKMKQIEPYEVYLTNMV